MIALLALATLLLAASVWWLTRPLRTASVPAAGGEERAELVEVRDRLIAQLSELDAERADRGIESGVARDEELRLSAELAAVLKRLEGLAPASGVTPVPPMSPRMAWRTTAALAVLVLLVAGGLYTWLNAANLQGFVTAARRGADSARVPPMVFEMVSRLEKRLAENPEDAGGWARLARSYVVLERKDQALTAYAKAHELAPEDVAVLSDYAWLVFNQDPAETRGLVQTLYGRLAKLAPNHPDALWFAGYAAYQQGDYRRALATWERLLKILPPEDPGREHLKQAIAGARTKAQR